MGLGSLFRSLWWPGSPDLPGASLPTRAPRPRFRKGPILLGSRVRLLVPIASSHTVWIPAGAAGLVVGGNPRTRQVSVELDTPRTVITVPWAWVEDAPAAG